MQILVFLSDDLRTDRTVVPNAFHAQHVDDTRTTRSDAKRLAGRIGSIVMKKQAAFFDGSALALRPFTLTDLRKEVGHSHKLLRAMVPHIRLKVRGRTLPLDALLTRGISKGALSATAGRAIAAIAAFFAPASTDTELHEHVRSAGLIHKSIPGFRAELGMPDHIERGRCSEEYLRIHLELAFEGLCPDAASAQLLMKMVERLTLKELVGIACGGAAPQEAPPTPVAGATAETLEAANTAVVAEWLDAPEIPVRWDRRVG